MAAGEMAKRIERQSVRVPVRGCASVHWRGRRRRYTLDNVSLGGALLLGTPSPSVGQRVLAVLSVDGSRPVSVTGKVIRVTERREARPAFAVQFSRAPADLRDMLSDSANAMSETGAPQTVILVARSRLLREQLSHWLGDAGWRVVGVSTPLEAVAALEREPAAVRWVVTLDRLTQTAGTELLSYVADTYPSVHRLLVSPPTNHERARAAISEGVADAALLQPIQMKRLAEAVGRCPTLTSR